MLWLYERADSTVTQESAGRRMPGNRPGSKARNHAHQQVFSPARDEGFASRSSPLDR